MISKKYILILVGVAIILLSFFVFKYYIKYSDSSFKGDMSDISLKLKWKHQAQFAGNYVAAEKGFYKKAGININLIPFDFSEPIVDTVVSGKAQFGIAAADQIILARSEGKPLKAVAVIYRINPTVAYSLKEKNITKPQDFVGKKVGIQKSANIEYMYEAMMLKLGIDRVNIKEVDVGHDASELLAGTVDVSTGYIINEPNLAIESGKDVNIILMADYGVDMYADVLFTTDEMINNNPDLVGRFVKATIDGWRYAIEHESEAVGYVLKYAKNTNEIHESAMLRSSAPLIHTGTSDLGGMDRAGWEKSLKMLIDQKLIINSIELDDVYTTKFLDIIYNH